MPSLQMKVRSSPKKNLKYVNILTELIKLHNVHLFNLTPYKKCTVLKSTYEKLTYRKLFTKTMFQTSLNNDRGHRVTNTTA